MDYSIDGDDEDTNKSNNTSDKASYIGKEEALAIALAHSKVDKNQATELKVDFDYDDNKAVYEIDFETNDAEYEYKIDAFTGEVLRTESEERDKNKKNDKSPRPTKQPTSYLSEAIIKEIVFQHAGVDATKVKGLEIELDDDDDDDDRAIYEIDFKVGKFEYEYKVDAITGDILKSKVETDD